MPMPNNGLTKLVEECGELIAVAAKKTTYADTDEHPDGAGSLKTRLENEMGDVIAACQFVAGKLGLSFARVAERAAYKTEVFRQFDQEPPVDVRGGDRT